MSVPREIRLAASSLGVSRETFERLALFVGLLLQWNQRINLIGRQDTDSVWSRHILDSLQLLPRLPAGTTSGIDLGTGGGFPGLTLAIASGIHFDLVEADRRKAAFLAEAGRETGAEVTVHPCRIEAASLKPSKLITSRALAPLDRLLNLASPLLAPGGVCLFLKGKRANEEIAAASTSWTMKLDVFRSIVDSAGVVLRVSEIARAR